jgi:subtilisin family serine protease
MSGSSHLERSPLDDMVRERTRGQIQIIVDALGEGSVGVATDGSDDPADFIYLYRKKNILVRDPDVDRVVAALARLDVGAEVSDNLVNGLTRLALSGDGTVPDVLDRLDAAVGIGVATPDQILYVTPNRCCPATEPEEPGTKDPLPAVSLNACDGSGVLVSVVDTGWYPPAATDPVTPWLADVTGDPEVFDPNDIRAYAGHGTFVAGVVRGAAPRADVRVEGFLPNGGAIFESDITVQLCQALALGPDIISLSAGATSRGNRPLLSFEVFWDKFLSQVKGTVLVAAAGNDHTRAPFWPAAFPWAISVGAVDAHGRRADFSNFGSWVDVYALGVDMVNAYPHGTFITKEATTPAGEVRHFEGLARWSGTSFSTPRVAGLIAAEMSRTGLSARLAADQLLAKARAQAVPGVGPRL